MGLSSSTKPDKVATLSAEQQQLLDQLLGGASSAFPSGLQAILGQIDPEKTNEFFQQSVAQPAIQNFKAEILPAIQQSGANLGAKGGSSIDRQLAQAGSNLESSLAQQLGVFQQSQQQAGLQNLQQLLGQGLGTESFALQQKGLSPLAQFILGLGGSAAELGGAYLGKK